jgi:hypothetical protein
MVESARCSQVTHWMSTASRMGRAPIAGERQTTKVRGCSNSNSTPAGGRRNRRTVRSR